MVADELAIQLADAYVLPGSRVLDPFCGSGRLLAASERASARVGIDTNPLAWLISTAKLHRADPQEMAEILDRLPAAGVEPAGAPLPFMTDRKVSWFSDSAVTSLSQLVRWVNRQSLSPSAMLLVASLVSATARDCSYARAAGWKLHRMSEAARSRKQADAWASFRKRLSYCVTELGNRSDHLATSKIILGQADDAGLTEAAAEGQFDVVLTSPPYGDSRTTVQYGAASELCLSVVRHLEGLSPLFTKGSEIDAKCVGGRRTAGFSEWREAPLKEFWAGGSSNAAGPGVRRFLAGYSKACIDIASVVKPGGRAIFVVGRRSTGGYRLKLDDFTIAQLDRCGFTFEDRFERGLRHKRSPRWINRYGRAGSEEMKAGGAVPTFDRDIVVVMRKRLDLNDPW